MSSLNDDNAFLVEHFPKLEEYTKQYDTLRDTIQFLGDQQQKIWANLRRIRDISYIEKGVAVYDTRWYDTKYGSNNRDLTAVGLRRIAKIYVNAHTRTDCGMRIIDENGKESFLGTGYNRAEALGIAMKWVIEGRI